MKVTEMLIIALMFFLVFSTGVYVERRTNKPQIEYYSVRANGKIQKVDSIIVYPLQAKEDVKDVWPVYYAFVEVGKMRFKTTTFIFSDNPAIQGEIDGRMVYYFKEKE